MKPDKLFSEWCKDFETILSLQAKLEKKFGKELCEKFVEFYHSLQKIEEKSEEENVL